MTRGDRFKARWADAVLVLVLVVVTALVIILFGWRALVDYIEPSNATERKEAVQVYAVIVAGTIAAVTAGVGLLNLGLTRRNLQQQRILEDRRAQGAALQAYYEQIGKLMLDEDLLNTEDEGVRALARGLTLAVMRNLDAGGKRSLMRFLQGAGLVEVGDDRAIPLDDANLKGADLSAALLENVDLSGALLQNADLSGADLRGSSLKDADLRGADLREVEGKDNEQVAKETSWLKGAIMPDGSNHP